MKLRTTRSAGLRSIRRRVVALVVIGALFVAAGACSDETDATSGGPEPDGLPDWNDPSRIADLGDGWTIAACEGDAPLLCVASNGDVAGTIESIRFPVASFAIVDPARDDLANLQAVAADFTSSLQADRLVGCGADYGFSALPVVPFSFGGVEGLSYGFVGTNSDGSESETNLQYAMIQGDELVLIAAIAYDQGGCPGRDDLSGFDSATLVELRGRIESTLELMAPPTA